MTFLQNLFSLRLRLIPKEQITPGSFMLIQYPDTYSKEQQHHIAKSAEYALKGVRVVMAPADLTFTLMTDEPGPSK